jgi:subtilisin family serine protease
VLALTLLVVPAVPGHAKDRDRSKQSQHSKLDKVLSRRAAQGGGTSRVIVVFKPGTAGTEEIGKHGSKSRRRFWLVNAEAADVPNSVLKRLANDPAIESIHEDRSTKGALNRVAVSVGARAVQNEMGFKGTGVGVAVIDSGITSWHDDLTYNGTSSAVRTKAGQRVVAFADFINGRSTPYDDNGHGTHVAGTIAGNGYDTFGVRAGMAPEAHLIGLKVLDQNGRGVISDVIAALEWTVANDNVLIVRADFQIIQIGPATELFHDCGLHGRGRIVNIAFHESGSCPPGLRHFNFRFSSCICLCSAVHSAGNGD